MTVLNMTKVTWRYDLSIKNFILFANLFAN